MKTEKRCNICHQLRPLSKFYKRTASPDGLQNTCTDCHDSYVKKSKYDPKSRGKKTECANPGCAIMSSAGQMVPHNGELICGACYRLFTLIQERNNTTQKYMESNKMYGSSQTGIDEC